MRACPCAAVAASRGLRATERLLCDIAASPQDAHVYVTCRRNDQTWEGNDSMRGGTSRQQHPRSGMRGTLRLHTDMDHESAKDEGGTKAEASVVDG